MGERKKRLTGNTFKPNIKYPWIKVIFHAFKEFCVQTDIKNYTRHRVFAGVATSNSLQRRNPQIPIDSV